MSEELLVNMEGNEEHFPNRDGIIRYGDHITIKHKKTKRFLASTDQGYLWGSFLQKVFTLEEISHECYWIVLPTVESEEEMNTEVNWNDFVRLKHVFTRSNLHSEDFESMVISEQEVSAYGVRGQTDENDVWIVRAANDQRDDFWRMEEPFLLIHVETDKYLHSGFDFLEEDRFEVAAVGECDTEYEIWVPTFKDNKRKTPEEKTKRKKKFFD